MENLNNLKDLYVMANFDIKDSGLPYNIWFDEAQHFRKGKHNTPRVKVQVNDNLIPVSISTKPKILLKGSSLSEAEKEFHGKNEIFEFISKNYGLIISHWNGEITTKTLLNSLEI